jgi:hypothetical protein
MQYRLTGLKSHRGFPFHIASGALQAAPPCFGGNLALRQPSSAAWRFRGLGVRRDDFFAAVSLVVEQDVTATAPNVRANRREGHCR